MYKKVNGHSCLSPPGLELGGCSKYWYVSKIILYWNRQLDSFPGWLLPKLTIISKNCSNKSCLELNFIQKVQENICLSPPRVEPGAPKICTFEILKCTEMEKTHSSTPGADRYIAPINFFVRNSILNNYLKLFSI